MEGKIDRRVIKTKERLYKVFMELLAEKQIKDITVKELSERADINRATFYLHYTDVFDLLEQIKEEIICNFEKVCESLSLNFTDEEFIAAFIKLLDYIKENRQLCVNLLVSNNDKTFFERLIKVVMDKCFVNENFTKFNFSFGVSGCVGVIVMWVSNNMTEPSEVVAAETLKLLKVIYSASL